MNDPATASEPESPADLFGEDLGADDTIELATNVRGEDVDGVCEPEPEPEEISPAEAQAVAAATAPKAEKPKKPKVRKPDATLDPMLAYLREHGCVPVAELCAQVHGGAVDEARVASTVRLLKDDGRFGLSLKGNKVCAELVAGEEPAAAAPAKPMITVGHIAKACHEMNRAYCVRRGDHSQVPWDKAPEWQQSSAIKGVQLILDHPETMPADSHASWFTQKLAEGWVYGPTKDAEKKTHPCMVAYEALPVEQRAKDYVFGQTVRQLAELPPLDIPEDIDELICGLAPLDATPIEPAPDIPTLAEQLEKREKAETAARQVDESTKSGGGVVQSPEKGPRNQVESVSQGWKSGDGIVHATFGLGRVVELKGAGDGVAIVIDFEGHGHKELALLFAADALKRPVAPAAVAVPSSAPRFKKPETEAERFALELILRRERDAQITSMAQIINGRKSAEQGLRQELSESYEKTKEMEKELRAISAVRFDLDTELRRLEAEAAKQQKLDFAAKPAAPAKPVDPKVIPPHDHQADYQLGVAAAKAKKLEKDNPFSKEVTPRKRASWFAGYYDTLREPDSQSEAIKHALTAAHLEEAHKKATLPPGSVPAIAAVTVYDSPCLVLGSILEGETRRWFLQPLFTTDQWKHNWQDTLGRAIAEADQSEEAKAQRQLGGLNCGREVKVGRKKYIVGPQKTVLVVTTPDVAAAAQKAKKAKANTPDPQSGTDEPAKDAKQRAAGD